MKKQNEKAKPGENKHGEKRKTEEGKQKNVTEWMRDQLKTDRENTRGWTKKWLWRKERKTKSMKKYRK